MPAPRLPNRTALRVEGNPTPAYSLNPFFAGPQTVNVDAAGQPKFIRSHPLNDQMIALGAEPFWTIGNSTVWYTQFWTTPDSTGRWQLDAKADGLNWKAVPQPYADMTTPLNIEAMRALGELAADTHHFWRSNCTALPVILLDIEGQAWQAVDATTPLPLRAATLRTYAAAANALHAGAGVDLSIYNFGDFWLGNYFQPTATQATAVEQADFDAAVREYRQAFRGYTSLLYMGAECAEDARRWRSLVAQADRIQREHFPDCEGDQIALVSPVYQSGPKVGQAVPLAEWCAFIDFLALRGVPIHVWLGASQAADCVGQLRYALAVAEK